MIVEIHPLETRLDECCTLLEAPSSKRDAAMVSRTRALLEEVFRVLAVRMRETNVCLC